MNIIQRLWNYEPAILAWALSGGLAVLLGNVFHITSTQQAAVTTILAALATIVTAWKTKEKDVSTIVGALVTIATAAAAFGLHLSSSEMGAAAAVLSGILALVFRANLTPAKARPA